MFRKITALEALAIGPEKSLQSRYKPVSESKDVLWRDIQALCHSRKYVAAYECAVLLKNIVKKEEKRELYKRCLLIISRLSVLLSDPCANDSYRELIKEEYTDLFVYMGPYSYNMGVFRKAETCAQSVYSFIFDEYLMNVKKSKTKEKQENLFYRLIKVHMAHKDPWDYEETNVDLSALPPHIREQYVQYTTDVLDKDEYVYKRERVEGGSSGVNLQNSKYFKNFSAIYKNKNS
ncbi:hypothetical protein NEMIN01_1906 [Nematocida minor]|uniref:uncharacterized protein n=1 Tax=Nematocida minor TaxID=1912983 RepID=UPI002220297D|nr:uncharacterized protein NEMIN01_1906 [Nematocida minor]KAI5192254.1 hypothetical protein NEMIN01_1906 [Nematocida minor]